MKKGTSSKVLNFLFPNLSLLTGSLRLITKRKMKTLTLVSIISGVVFVLVVIFGFLMFPRVTKNKIKSQIALRPGSEIREMYLKTPFPLDFKVYLFNITNAAAVVKGESPVLDEIGPYFFDFWKSKVNVKDDETNDTLMYNGKMKWIFNKAKSSPLTGKEMITIPHPLMLGMVTAVYRDKPAMLSLVAKAINSIFRNPESPFVTATANEIMFDGLIVNCTVSDFAGKAACTQIKSEGKGLQWISETEFKLSFFGDKNDTADERAFVVKRGIENYKDVGKVILFDNKTEMDVWPTKECNQYQGTDSTIFAPLLVKEEGIVAYSPDICRSLSAVFDREDTIKDIKVYRYTASLGDMSTDKKLKCYCPKPNACLKRGLMDISKCVGAPMYVSLPHFYDSDESYVHGVRGLRPREDEHGIFMYFEPLTGTPLSARKRLQFSMPLEPIPKVSFMKDMPQVILPIFWVEEGAELGDEYLNQLKSAFKLLLAVDIIKWLLFVLSIFAGFIAGCLHYYNTTSMTVTPSRDPGEKRSSVVQTIESAHNMKPRF